MKLALTASLADIIRTCGHPPLGIAFIASYLRKYGNFHNTIIIDKEDEMKRIRDEKPDVLGISLHSIEVESGIKLAKKVKSEFDIPVIVGGAHYTFMPKTLPDCFDVAVMREGEHTTLELMQLFERTGGFNPDDLKKIKGIAYHKNNNIEITEGRGLIKDLDIVPLPARDLLKMEEYYLKPRRIFRGYLRRGTHMMSSRGCPYKCVYCCSSKFWKTIRFHSAERVLEEFKELINKYKVEAITLYDDLFIADKKRLRKISELVQQEIPGKLIFNCQGRANLMNDETCKLLKKSQLL